MRNNARLWIAAAIIAVVILLSFVLSTPHAREVVKTVFTPSVATSTPSVTIHDSYKKGTHTITGTVEAPNACTAVTADAVPVQDDDATSTEGIVVVISMPDDTGVCLQEPAAVDFTTTIDAAASLPIRATVNGIVASTTVL